MKKTTRILTLITITIFTLLLLSVASATKQDNATGNDNAIDTDNTKTEANNIIKSTQTALKKDKQTTKKTTIDAYKIKTVEINTTVKISGKLTSQNQALKNQKINIKVNGEKYNTTTYSNGYFTINYQIKTYKTHNITYTYKGNREYAPSNNTTFFKVKQPTKITFYQIKDANHYNKTVKVSGKLLQENRAIKNAKISLNINDENHTLTTYSTGYFTLNYKVTQYGQNTVKAVYNGSTQYMPSNNTMTFTAKTPVTLQIYKIKTPSKDSQVQISGKAHTLQKAIKNANLTIRINNKKISTTTSKTGYFKTYYNVTGYQTHTVIITYADRDNQKTTNQTTFNVKKPSNIEIYTIKNPKYKTTIILSGKLTSHYDNKTEPVKSQKITIKINNKKITTKTTKTGYFKITYTVKSYENHNINITYDGSNKYEKTDNYYAFRVSQPNKIQIKTKNTVKKGKTLKITGKATGNKTKKALKNWPISIEINDETIQTRTNNTGYFTYNYKTRLPKGNHTITYTVIDQNYPTQIKQKLTVK